MNRAFCLCALAGAGLLACPSSGQKQNAEGEAESGASAVAAIPASQRPHWNQAQKPPRVALPCRAIAVSGNARPSLSPQSPPLKVADEIPDAWLALSPDAKLTAKHPRTTRETTYAGPGPIRPCVHGEEEAWMVAGVFESAPGAGESPGAEEWVLTPLGALRYVGAGLRMTVGAALELRIERGTAFVLPANDTHADRR